MDIAITVLLCISNSKRAKARGKSSGAAIAYTIALCIGFEFIGAYIGILLFGFTTAIFFVAFGFTILGGVISYLISKQGETKTYVAPYSLPYPCTIKVFRDSSSEHQDQQFFFYLNGQVLDALEADSMLIANTKQSHNTLGVRIGSEQFMRDTYQFIASSNGVVEVHCSGGKFAPELTKTTLVGGTQQEASPPAVPPQNNNNDW